MIKYRNAVVLGGDTGIGAAVAARLGVTYGKNSVHAFGRDDYDITGEKGNALLKSKVAQLAPSHLVYSIGVNRLDWPEDVLWDDFDEIMHANVWGFMSVYQALLAVGRPVSLVAVTSDAAHRPMRTSMVYCASKAALEMAVRVASREQAPNGWRVNAVAPGKVAGTPMTEYVDKRVPVLREWSEEYAAQYERNSSPIGRPVTLDEISVVIHDVLTSPSMAWTGDVITVNGGR